MIWVSMVAGSAPTSASDHVGVSPDSARGLCLGRDHVGVSQVSARGPCPAPDHVGVSQDSAPGQHPDPDLVMCPAGPSLLSSPPSALSLL